MKYLLHCCHPLVLLAFLALGSAVASGQSSSNNGVENNCSNNFFLMEQSLLLSTDNRFNLMKTFYPPREAHPVLVKINYSFDGVENSTTTWFWSESEFYLIQPLEIFMFTSLFFSNMPYRKSELSLLLDKECVTAPDQYLELLTTRLKLYTQSATTGPMSPTQRITDSYLAIAISWQQVSADSLQTDFVKVWLHITVALFPFGTWLLLYLCDPIQLLLGDKTWTKLEDEHSHGTIAAMIQLSVVFTVYVFVLDIAGIYFTVTSTFITYDSNAAFYLSTVTGVIVDVGAFVWVVGVLVSSCHWDCRHFFERVRNREMCRGSDRVKKLVSTITVAPVVCLANHIHYIMIAFISDPFHAGSIAIVYTIAFFLYFFMFRQFYNRVVLHSNKRPKIVPRMQVCPQCSAREKLWHPIHKITSTTSTVPLTPNENVKIEDLKCDCFIPGPDCHTPFNMQVLIFGVVTVGPFVTLYLAVMIILFFSLPITKSIEDAPSRIYTIYQGTGLIIVALLTYNIVLHPSPFSISKTLERLAKRLRLPESTNYWNRLSDEEKFAKVIVTLLETHFRSGTQGSKNKGGGDEESSGEEGSMEDLGVQMTLNSVASNRRRKHSGAAQDKDVVKVKVESDV